MSNDNQNSQDKVFYFMNEGLAEGTIFLNGADGKDGSLKVFEKNAILTLNQTPTKGKNDKGHPIPIEKGKYTEFTVFPTKGSPMSFSEEMEQLKARLFQGEKAAKVFVKYSYESSWSKEKGSQKTARLIWVELVFSEKGCEMLEKQAEFLKNKAEAIRKGMDKPHNHARSIDGTPKVDDGDLPF